VREITNDIIAALEDKQLVLGAPPQELTGRVELHDPGKINVVIRDAGLNDPSGMLISRPLRHALPALVLRPDQGRTLPLVVAIDKKTPPARFILAIPDALSQPERLATTVSNLSQPDELLVLAADLNDSAQAVVAVDAAVARFGHIDLVVHGAARVDAAAFASAAETGPEVVEAQFSPKLRGLFNLRQVLRGREPKRWVLHSSISSVLGGLGLAAYAGVNAMLDALALAGGDDWISIDWDAWDNAAEAQSAGMPKAIHPPEGQEAFLRILGAIAGSRLLVVVNDLATRLQAWVRHDDTALKKGSVVERHPRPNLTTVFMEVRALLGPLGSSIADDRFITPNVLASCDDVAATRAHAFDEQSALIDNFLAVPGSAVYEQMRSGAWEYRIMWAKRA
jgi:KR domain